MVSGTWSLPKIGGYPKNPQNRLSISLERDFPVKTPPAMEMIPHGSPRTPPPCRGGQASGPSESAACAIVSEKERPGAWSEPRGTTVKSGGWKMLTQSLVAGLACCRCLEKCSGRMMKNEVVVVLAAAL